MKNLISLLILLVALISCDKKEEAKPMVIKQEHKTTDAIVGTDNDGVYDLSNIDDIKYKWNAYVNKKLKPKDSIVLEQFEIIKTKTQDATAEDCYLLIGKAKKQKVTVGTILSLKEGKFYTDLKQNSGFKAYEVLICNGSCGENICNPSVVVAGGSKRLICSSCDECAKISGSID